MVRKKRRTISHVVDELFGQLAQVEKKKNHDRSAKFTMGEKPLAHYVINHHGDGRVALWLKIPHALQETLLELGDSMFFLPPYLGKQGWVGIDLSMSTKWDEVFAIVLVAYEYVSGRSRDSGTELSVEPPTDALDATEIDPFDATNMRDVMRRLRSFLEQLPDVQETTHFGRPVFKTGKKTFLWTGFLNDEPCVEIWVGKEAQVQYHSDSRFAVPKYTGHNGWMLCQTNFAENDDLVRELIVKSFRHFARKRTLKKLDAMNSAT